MDQENIDISNQQLNIGGDDDYDYDLKADNNMGSKRRKLRRLAA
jgi:hypothetical protein